MSQLALLNVPAPSLPAGSMGAGTGIIYQGHDAFAIEVEGEIVDTGKTDKKGRPVMGLKGPAREVYEEMRERANFTPSGWEVAVTSDVRFGYTLKDCT